MTTAGRGRFDTIVVGAGVEGSATALQLARKGRRTLLLEQFPLPHSRGSSHGQSRVTRKSYPEEFYCHMMNYCTEAWKDIQQRTSIDLYKQIGYLAIGEENGQFLRDTIQSMSQHDAEYTVLNPAQFAARFPMLRYPGNIGGILDPNGGILMADKALQALQILFRAQGGALRDNEKVLAVKPGQEVQIVTSKTTYTCNSAVLCCGPWANRLLQPLQLTLPLQIIRISVCYWPEKQPGSHGPDKLPTFFEQNCCIGYSIFGLPSQEYPGHVKLCLHGGPSIDPEARDAVDYSWADRGIKSYVAKHFPGLQSEPSIMENCIYTNTPDKHFILDFHPKWRNIVIGAGFSGHGFKLAPAVGLILSELATGQKPSYDISHFKIARFDSKQGGQSKL